MDMCTLKQSPVDQQKGNMSTKKTHTLYFFSSKKCGHCDTFIQNHLQMLIQELNKMNAVNFEHIEFEQTDINAKTNKQFPSKLKAYIRHFPMFILVDDYSINSNKPSVAIFNMSVDSNGKMKYDPTHSMDAVGVIAWLSAVVGADSGPRIVSSTSSKGKTCLNVNPRPR